MTNEQLRQRALSLRLHGLVARWGQIGDEPWVRDLLESEDDERQKRSLANRLKNSRIGAIKPMADFDWGFPTRIPRDVVEDLLTSAFVDEHTNAVLIGPNGVGKTMIAENVGYAAVLNGHTVRFTTASKMLAELALQDGSLALQRTLLTYTQPRLLIIDEIGYLSYDNRNADLLFEVVNRRYQKRSVVITTNRTFSEWSEIFPNAACVTALVDRLVHHAEVVHIEGDSYRAKEATEAATKRASVRRKAKK